VLPHGPSKRVSARAGRARSRTGRASVLAHEPSKRAAARTERARSRTGQAGAQPHGPSKRVAAQAEQACSRTGRVSAWPHKPSERAAAQAEQACRRTDRASAWLHEPSERAVTQAAGSAQREPGLGRPKDGDAQSEGSEAGCCSKLEPVRPQVWQSRGGRAVRATSPQQGHTQWMVRIINSLGLMVATPDAAHTPHRAHAAPIGCQRTLTRHLGGS
jgi:hypothetical protein